MSKRTKTILTTTAVIVSVLFSFIVLYGSNYIFFHTVYPNDYIQIIERMSKKYEVKTDLVYAIAYTESHFDADAISNAGAIGVMQLTTDTFEWLQTKKPLSDDVQGTSEELLLNPKINIEYGTLFLSILLDRYSVENTAICAYNAGISAVDSWLENSNLSSDGKTLKNIPYPETEEYVKKVNNAKDLYKKIYLKNNILDDFFYNVYESIKG